MRPLCFVLLLLGVLPILLPLYQISVSGAGVWLWYWGLTVSPLILFIALGRFALQGSCKKTESNQGLRKI